jgi:hypothetical protein
MPHVIVPPTDMTEFVTIESINYSYSEIQYTKGLLELIEFEFADLNPEADINARIYALVNPEAEEADWIWRFRYSIASVDPTIAYVPVLTVIESEAEDPITGGAHCPLRCPWRIRYSGATQGTITAYVSLDQG